MTLEQQFRNGLAGQLSSDKTEVEIRVAVRIAREFSKGFAQWMVSGVNFSDDTEEGRIYWYKHSKYTTEALLKLYEDEILSK